MSAGALEATRLLSLVGQGDQEAAARLLEVVYPELRALASGFMSGQRVGHTLQPTALVHEAFVKLIDQTRAEYNGRAHFVRVAARAMRQILVDHARAKNAEKRGGGADRARLTLDGQMLDTRSVVDIVALDDALRTLSELDERQGRVVELRFFGGLSVGEVAEVLGVSVSTVEEDWRMARAWLSRRLASNPATPAPGEGREKGSGGSGAAGGTA